NDAGCKKRGDLVTFYHAEEYNKYDLDVDIVRVTPRDLGFFQKMHTRRSTLYERAIELGLELAWPEIGLALRLAYLDQPKGEWLTVPTNVVDPVVFDRTMRIGNSPYEDKTRGIAGVLGIDLSVTEKHVRADEEFVFIKPRKEEAS
ncbi:MAG TPA: hypothetical protein VHL10_02895, partial [Nitrososphaera sp.]|nr:hypothetical protein [Nitrososphaera sp.]